MVGVSLVLLTGPLMWRPVRADPPVRATSETSSPGPQHPGIDASPSPASAQPATSASSNAPTSAVACNEQHANPALIRHGYVQVGGSSDEARRRREAHVAAIRYRTEHYGYFPGFGASELNQHPPSYYAVTTRWMGHTVRVHRAIVPALACVERDIAARCSETPYHPRQLEGLRRANSFRGGEVSNHVYGIAVDVDPQRNPCCGCGTMFANHPGCTRRATSIWERMEMPPCWVQSFERYGFYWLGNDRQLRDLMHFEFLADPDRIVRR